MFMTFCHGQSIVSGVRGKAVDELRSFKCNTRTCFDVK